ncbi:MAG: hypothetical protein ACI9XC_001396 [Gammaproteobacteria bacterium]
MKSNSYKLMSVVNNVVICTMFVLLYAEAGFTQVADTLSEQSQALIVDYTASYFSRYKPETALDMVQQLPGFQVDNGDLSRGFTDTIGNILINDNYPSAKQDRPAATLDRIPASQVERIELIRGQVRGIDLQGHSVVANIILKVNAQAAIRWEAWYEENNHGPDRPGVNMSLADNWESVEYLVGLRVQREASGETGPENVVDADGTLTEIRDDDRDMTGMRFSGNLNASTQLGQTLAQLNTNFLYKTNNSLFISNRSSLTAGGNFRSNIVDEQEAQKYIEVGFDAERKLNSNFLGKAILLFFYQEIPLLAKRRVVEVANNLNTLRIADSNPKLMENIARLEFEWTGVVDHSVRINLEGTFNSLENSLLQTLDSGTGPVVIDVPGANTRLEEIRGDFLLKDIWTLGTLELDYGIGAEVSTIKQTGDADEERSFFFLKPGMILTYSPDQSNQTRVHIFREVSQLNFNDFVSSAIFEDNDLALGNPDLRPETTWKIEMDHERRFAMESVISLTLFYHWISNVEDLLPLTDLFEAPGNIGKGKRWGIEFEGTLPLQWMGIQGAKLDLKARWQDSIVTDPVTGTNRILTASGGFAGPPAFKFNSENKFAYNIAYRQDFEEARIAWGIDFSDHAERPRFNVNELEIYHEGELINAFIETTRLFDMKIRFHIRNLLDYNETRNRTVYTGRRGLSPVDFMLLRSRLPGRRLTLTLSGSF